MSDWFTVLKDVKQIQSTGIRTKLGTTPLTMGDEDDDDCCEKAHTDMLNLMDSIYNHHTLSQLFRNGAWAVKQDLEEIFTVLDERECTKLRGTFDEYWDYFRDIQLHFRTKKGSRYDISNWTLSQEYRDASNILSDIEEITLEWDLCDD